MAHQAICWPFIMCMVLLACASILAASPSFSADSIGRVGSVNGPTTLTDASGHFRFAELHRSSHVLRVDRQTLPRDIGRIGDTVMTLSPGVTQAIAVAPGVVLSATYHDESIVDNDRPPKALVLYLPLLMESLPPPQPDLTVTQYGLKAGSESRLLIWYHASS